MNDVEENRGNDSLIAVICGLAVQFFFLLLAAIGVIVMGIWLLKIAAVLL